MPDINNMKVYTHPNVEGSLTIKAKYGEVVTCNLIDKPMIHNIHGKLVYETIITTIENLTLKP